MALRCTRAVNGAEASLARRRRGRARGTLMAALRFEVGSPCPYQVTSPTYLWTGAHNVFALPLDGVTAEEQRCFDNGTAEFALFVEQPAIVLMYRFGVDLPWGDAAFNVHSGEPMLPEASRELLRTTDPAVSGHALISLVLIEAISGIVRGLRAVTFSTEFSRRFLGALRAQLLAGPVPDSAFDACVRNIHARYPTVVELLGAAEIRTMGGA